MKFILSLFITLFVSSFAIGQPKESDAKDFTFDKKTNEFSDASGVVFKLEKIKSLTGPGMHNYYFTDKDGKRLVLFAFRNHVKVDDFHEISFPGTSIPSCEVSLAWKSITAYAKIFYQRKIIVNGKLNETEAKMFSEETGKAFSR